MMKIPVFLSCPTPLNRDQERLRSDIIAYLDELELEPRALGRSDYPAGCPLREIHVVAKDCFGGLILGFEQIRAVAGVVKPGTDKEYAIEAKSAISIPTPWNQVEAGILFGLHLPLLIFREAGITGGVFDEGVTDVLAHTLGPSVDPDRDAPLRAVFGKWYAKVSQHYYS